MRRCTLILAFSTLAGMTASGQSPYRNVQVSGPNDSGFPNEPSIVINPNNTLHMLAGSNLRYYYYSTDGGLNWAGAPLTSSYGVWGDPCVVVDTNNNYYFFHLSYPAAGTPPTPGSWIDRIVCQKLTDFGSTWSDGTHTGLNGAKAQDKQWAVVDRSNNRIYVTWTQFDNYGSTNPGDISIIRFSASGDGGLTWSTPVRINKVAGDCRDGGTTVEGAVPAIGPNGEILVAWAGPSGIVFDKSSDAGITWLEDDIFVSDVPGGWDFDIPGIYRANGLPVTACDISPGPHRGTIYVNWSDQRNGTADTDIWLVKSTDGGATWSPRKRVNDDPPGSQQFFCWMTIDQGDGAIYIGFYDRRNYGDIRTDFYLAVSRDGGDSFVNTRISQSPFTPNQNTFFGDYTNISAHNGVVRPIWTRLDNSTPSLWTAMVNPLPEITDIAVSNGSVRLSVRTSASYMINVERSFNLQPAGSWTQVDTFAAMPGVTWWTEPLGSGWSKAFYRLSSY